MDLMSIFEKYYIQPIWDHSGYNMVNTMTYAILVIVSLYIIWSYMKRKKIEVDDGFYCGAIGFILFGATMRVVTDSIDSGAMRSYMLENAGNMLGWIYGFILENDIADYGYMTASPGIYIVTSILFFSSVFLERRLTIRYFSLYCGLSLAVMNLLILMPMIKFALFGLLAIVLAALPVFIVRYLMKIKKWRYLLAVFAHCLDGAATWVAIDFFGPMTGMYYNEQHVVSRIIGEMSPFGFGLFFLLKAGFSIAAIKLLKEEEDKTLVYIALIAITVMGLAPGLRGILRMIAQT